MSDFELSNAVHEMDLPGVANLLQAGMVPGVGARLSLTISYYRGEESISRRSEILRHLLNHGLDPRVQNHETRTTLLHEVCAENAPVNDIRLVLEAGAREVINTRDMDDNTPLLCYAKRCIVPQCLPPVESGFDLLLVAGADISAIDSGGRTAEQILRDRPSMRYQRLADYLAER